MADKGKKGRSEIVAAVIVGVATILAAFVGVLYLISSKYSDLTLLDFAFKEEQLLPTCEYSVLIKNLCGIHENPLISSNQGVAECVSNQLFADDTDTLITIKPKSILFTGFLRQIPNTDNRGEGVMLLGEEFDSSMKASLFYTLMKFNQTSQKTEPYVSVDYFQKGNIVLILASLEVNFETDHSLKVSGSESK